MKIKNKTLEEPPLHKEHNNFKRFLLVRKEDISGVSGTGVVAQGIQFSDGTAILKWTTTTSSVGVYHSTVELLAVHGHGNATTIEWID